jgi:hypothetical protein
MTPEKVIFAIDNNTDTHTIAKFLRYVDTLRAMSKISPVVQCLHKWEDIIEVSYMMNRVDYEKHVKGKGWADAQDCVLIVSGDVRQPCHLLSPSGETKSVGPMVQIEAPVGNWTYVPATNKYFTCKS